MRRLSIGTSYAWGQRRRAYGEIRDALSSFQSLALEIRLVETLFISRLTQLVAIWSCGPLVVGSNTGDLRLLTAFSGPFIKRLLIDESTRYPGSITTATLQKLKTAMDKNECTRM